MFLSPGGSRERKAFVWKTLSWKVFLEPNGNLSGLLGKVSCHWGPKGMEALGGLRHLLGAAPILDSIFRGADDVSVPAVAVFIELTSLSSSDSVRALTLLSSA